MCRMSPDPSNPHDGLVRRLLGDAADADSELRLVLPDSVVAQLDWNELERVDGTFVSAELRSRYTDLLFRTHTVSGCRVLVYLLLEHQSRPDPLMAFRMLEYKVGIIRR